MPALTHPEAVARAACLAVESYDIDLDLTGGDEAFQSTTTIRFGALVPAVDSFVEIRPQRLVSVTLNGTTLDPALLHDNRLPLTGLRAENELVVTAVMRYSNSGEGLHRYVDPADGATYLYAQTALDAAQRVFACFDQPDLKARFTLTVTADPRWTVLANTTGQHDGQGRWVFPQSLPLSTYLITLIAGPYHSHLSSHDGIPLGLHCRASLAEALEREAGELFNITAACLDEYHRMFDLRYPFGKYDQVFVPEFNLGAMENPGCVTFRDEYLFDSAATESERQDRAVVIAHEMAHMWFGDLVTMRWWDDLWLNESFAEYMGYRVTAAATQYRTAWTSFATSRKGWGYLADQRPSTHPVAPTSVRDTEEATTNIDGISYAKGAAVLQQLVAWVGDEVFRAGLNAYFAEHQFANASLDDLLAALGRASGRDLGDWARSWLRTAQVNTLTAVPVLDGQQRYESVTITQSAHPDYPMLRPHRIGVGVYDLDPAGGPVRRRNVITVDLDPGVDEGRTTLTTLTGAPVADLLLVNDGDQTYAKIQLDERSLDKLPVVLPALGDDLARGVVWGAVISAVRDAALPASAFVSLMVSALPSERHVSIFVDVLRFATGAGHGHRIGIGTMVDHHLNPERRDHVLTLIREVCETVLDEGDPADPRLLVAARGLIRASVNDDHFAQLRGWLVGVDVPAGLLVDADLRWQISYQLALRGVLTEAEIDEESARDRSGAGGQWATRCRAARPDPAAKVAAWRTIMADPDASNRIVEAAAEGFWQPGQRELTEPYVARYFAEIMVAAAARPPYLAERIAALAFPHLAVDPSTVAAAQDLLRQEELPASVRRAVVDQADDLERVLAARHLDDTALPA